MAGQGHLTQRRLELHVTRHWRGVASIITSLLLLSSVVAVHRATGDGPDTQVVAGEGVGPGAAGGPLANLGGSSGSDEDGSGPGARVKGARAGRGGVDGSDGSGAGGSGGKGDDGSTFGAGSSYGGSSRGGGSGGGDEWVEPPPPPVPPSGRTYTGKAGQLVPPGVTDDEIEVIYYWTDRTRDSPYRPDSGQANLDEGQAFEAFIEWINRHSGDGSTVMGYPFHLHGRKLKPKVIELDKSPESRATKAEEIASVHRPFATLASHGSISTYMCDRIAQGGVHNLSTYDFRGNLHGRTNGYCFPLGMSWEVQVERMVAYLKKHKDTRYETAPGVTEPRRYAIVYADYPGLHDSIDGPGGVKQRLEAAGVTVAYLGRMSPDLGASQTQVPTMISDMRKAEVNTVIFPDAGAPLNFTHGAQANGWRSDYVVWPCSGTDTIGMVRLYNPTQWSRASGITCYDDHFNPDLVNDDNARATEWYRVWVEMRGSGKDAPSSGSLIWFNLLPLVAGITESGAHLTVPGFREGLAQVPNYRYDAIAGRTTNPVNFLQTVNRTDHSPVGDVAKVRWDPSRTRPGSSTQGSYAYPENRRYGQGQPF